MQILNRAYYRQSGNDQIHLLFIENNGEYIVEMTSHTCSIDYSQGHSLVNQSYGDYALANANFHALKTALTIMGCVAESEIDPETGEEYAV